MKEAQDNVFHKRWKREGRTIFSVTPVEIFASKTAALPTRTTPRDLYEMHNMVRYVLFDGSEKEILRKGDRFNLEVI